MVPMRAVYWIGVIAIAALAGLFAASNRDPVSLGLWPLPFVAVAPIYLLVTVSVLFGILIGAFAVWIKGGRRRREYRECRRQNAALSRELATTQARLAQLAPSSDEAMRSLE